MNTGSSFASYDGEHDTGTRPSMHLRSTSPIHAPSIGAPPPSRKKTAAGPMVVPADNDPPPPPPAPLSSAGSASPGQNPGGTSGLFSQYTEDQVRWDKTRLQGPNKRKRCWRFTLTPTNLDIGYSTNRNKRQVKRELLSILNNLNRDAVAETAEVDTVTAAAPPATPAAAFPAAAPPAAVDAADAADVADPPDAGGVVDEENGKPVEEAPALEAGGPPPGAAPDDEGMEFFMDNEDIGYLVADTPPKETFDKLADFVAERASPAEDIWEGEFSEDHKCLSPPPAPGVGEEVCCLQEGEAFPFVPDELTRGDLKEPAPLKLSTPAELVAEDSTTRQSVNLLEAACKNMLEDARWAGIPEDRREWSDPAFSRFYDGANADGSSKYRCGPRS